jgi:probable F420-dependent oxidoreductase
LQFGIHLPHVGPFANPQTIAAVARHAEELGYHSVWASDHIITPRQIDSPYPGGRYPVLPEFPFLEPVATLLYAAAVTSRVALGTSVLVVPQRQPVLLAKQLATLDVLSGGRLIFGAGAGWMKEEFQALNVPFESHGQRLDDYLEVIRLCWTEDHPTFEGRFYDLPDIGFYPKPTQKPRPPIWVGGWAEGALRRAARFGDAWHAMGPPQLVGDAFARVKRYAAEYGRDPESIGLTLRAEGVGRGEAAETIEQLRAYAEVGVSMALMILVGRDLDSINEKLTGFMRDVAGRV